MKLAYVTGNIDNNIYENYKNLSVFSKSYVSLTSIFEANKWALENGYATVCPCLNSKLYSKDEDDTFINCCLTILERCDFVILAPEWTESETEVIEEIKFARACNIPIYTFGEDGDLKLLEE